MLDPWIIEEIIKREERAREERERARIELPLESPNQGIERTQVTPPEPESERGVVVIDI
jgi:hypothetical protein